MKYCPECGNPNEDAVQFCAACGFSFATIEQSTPMPQVTPPPQTVSSQPTQQSYQPQAVSPQPGYYPQAQQMEMVDQIRANPVKVLAMCVTGIAFVLLLPFIYSLIQDNIFRYLSGFRLVMLILQILMFLLVVAVGVILILKPDSIIPAQSNRYSGPYPQQAQNTAMQQASYQQPYQAPPVPAAVSGTAYSEQTSPQMQQSPQVATVATQPMQQQSNQPYAMQQNIIVMGKAKSVGVAFMLAFFFGPLGLLYASIIGGIVMFVVSIILFILIPVIGYVLAWVICIIWAIVAANQANTDLQNKAGGMINNNYRR